MFPDDKMAYLVRWAAENDCTLEPHGEVGFMRECVGIKFIQTYVDLPQYGTPNFDRDWAALPSPPEDAYHKHECLAVLVHNDDYDKALDQLYDWVRLLVAAKFVVEIRDREYYNQDGFGRHLEQMMHGPRQAVLTLKE